MVSLWSTERLIDSILFECGNFVNSYFYKIALNESCIEKEENTVLTTSQKYVQMVLH